MFIQIQLKDLVKNKELLENNNINPYCINEGADGDEYKIVEVKDDCVYQLK